jgi:hypothetical protein
MLMVVYGLLPLAVTIAFTCRLIESVGTTDWGRLWAAAVIACGTMLTTFAVVLTNHVPAAACVAVSGWLVWRITAHGVRSWTAFAWAGFWTALAAALELPALAWLAATLVLLLRCDARRTLLAAVPGVAVVATAALGTNWLAHDTVLPPYAIRVPHVPQAAAAPVPAAPAVESWNPDNWYDYAFRLPNGKLLQSYWRSPRGGDLGEPSAATYAWHVLLGHHGIFSLTPAWLLSIPGLVLLASARRRGNAGQANLAVAIGLVSLVVLAFYLSRPQLDRNYGGMTSGFRWAFWLAPLWVTAAVPAADRLARSTIGRGLGLLLLAGSVVSVAYPTWNPWTLPWIQQWLAHAGWITLP